MSIRRFALLPLFVAFVWACSSSETTPGAGSPDGGTTNDGGSSGGPSGDVCAVTREYIIECAGESELDCGADKFDAWCVQKDRKLNSDAFRQAETKCLPTVGCDGNERKDCEYKSYSGLKQTDAQKALVEAYCTTCEPSDTGCAARVVTYDEAGGPAAVTDVFIAVWELADPIVDQIREKCTGTALPAGADPCPKRFGSCAAGPYLDGLPDCP
jgi:hypothetical protein